MDYFDIDEISNLYEQTDPIYDDISFAWLNTLVSNSKLPVSTKSHASEEGKLKYQVRYLKSYQSNMPTPIDLSNTLGIRLNTDRKTLTATMHPWIRSTGLPSWWFCIYKSQLQYKQLTRQHGKLYTDYLNVGVFSVRKFIGGAIYTNKLGFNKFFPCINDTPPRKRAHTW